MKFLNNKSNNQKGFTLIELAIATSVFSIVLLMLMTSVIKITDDYYRGLTQSETQNVANNIVNTISQAIQFGGGVETVPTANNGSEAYCINGQLYSYLIGYEVEPNPNTSDNQAYHGLLVSTNGCSQPQNLTSPSSAGQELLGQNMRLAAFSITALPGWSQSYYIHVRVVYGSNNLLANGTSGPDVTCSGNNSLSRFCAVSDLSAVVQQRVQ